MTPTLVTLRPWLAYRPSGFFGYDEQMFEM
jgi:hypothetical protein